MLHFLEFLFLVLIISPFLVKKFGPRILDLSRTNKFSEEMIEAVGLDPRNYPVRFTHVPTDEQLKDDQMVFNGFSHDGSGWLQWKNYRMIAADNTIIVDMATRIMQTGFPIHPI